MRAEMALSCALLAVLAATLPVAGAVTPGGRTAATVDGPLASVDDTVPGRTSDWTGQATASHAQATAQSTQTAVADDRTVRIDVQLLESGDANWTVSTFVPLDDQRDRDAFRELGRRYENGTADVELDAELFEQFVATARSASGRPMSIPDASVQRDWTIQNETGVVVLQFTWENFAREQGDRLVVDDAFETRDGTWLPGLERGQTLVIRPPEGLGFLDAPTGVTNATLRWEGPQTFGPDYFHIVYRVDDDTPAGPRTDSPTDSETPTDEPPSGLPAGLFVVLALLGGGGAAAYLWVRRDGGVEGGDPRVPSTGDDPGGDGPTPGAATDGSDATVDPPGDADGEPDGPPEPTPEDPFAGVDVEMLSDEERVLRLLDANGGRMKQAQIVKETDWSNAKVSQLLSGMDDEDAIDKLRIGRENLISLPDVDVDSFDE